MKTNRLPKYWAVKGEDSKLFKDTVIKYMNEIDQPGQEGSWFGGDSSYYGYDGSKGNHGTAARHSMGLFTTGTVLLTLEQFIEMTTEWEPKRGDIVEVRDSEAANWVRRIYLTTVAGSHFSFITVALGEEEKFHAGRAFSANFWKFMREPKPNVIVIVRVNGKEVHPSTISKEAWDNFRDL